MKRLLTIGHSYVVALNRRLAHEMAKAGKGAWHVTAAAPARYRGDLRDIDLEPIPGEACDVVALSTCLDSVPHLTWYSGGLRALLRDDWDVVHCWEEPYVLSAAQVAAGVQRRSAFVFATFQNIAKTYPPPLNWFERRVLRRADGWIAFGHSVRETQSGRDGRYAALPSRVIQPGIDPETFTPDASLRRDSRAQLGWDDDTPVVGFVGRFVPEKGVDTLTAALDRVTSPWRALFVGQGPEQPLVDALAARYPGRVASLGGVTHGDVPRWLNAMDVLCAPSRTTRRWREQFGRMLIEAMACGVPVIASRSGEIPHVVADAGVLVQESDVEAWRQAIERVLGDGTIRAGLRARGVNRVREQFTWGRAAREHLAFFDQLT